MIVYLVVHSGFDFDPTTTLAVCTASDTADQMLKECSDDPDDAHFPWNEYYVKEVICDQIIHWEEDEEDE